MKESPLMSALTDKQMRESLATALNARYCRACSRVITAINNVPAEHCDVCSGDLIAPVSRANDAISETTLRSVAGRPASRVRQLHDLAAQGIGFTPNIGPQPDNSGCEPCQNGR